MANRDITGERRGGEETSEGGFLLAPEIGGKMLFLR